MATPKVTPDGDGIVAEIHIAALPERVFQAIVDSKQVVQWWGQTGIYRCSKFQADLRVGGKWQSEGEGPEGLPFTVSGEFLEVAPPRLLVYTWVASWTGDVKTTLRWELEPANQGTLVRIRHSGFASHPELAKSYRGWPRMLGWLQSFLETGETVDSRKPFSAA